MNRLTPFSSNQDIQKNVDEDNVIVKNDKDYILCYISNKMLFSALSD